MKRQRLFLTIVLLALLVSIAMLLTATTEAAPLFGSFVVTGRVLEFPQLATPGPCGFGQMAFLAPLGGLILVARNRNRVTPK